MFLGCFVEFVNGYLVTSARYIVVRIIMVNVIVGTYFFTKASRFTSCLAIAELLVPRSTFRNVFRER